MNELPLNPMLHKSLSGYYRIYCGSKDKMIGICDILKVPTKSVRFNEEWKVWEFVTSNKKYKCKINELFCDSNMVCLEPVDSDAVE
jgi:hypothetical protein